MAFRTQKTVFLLVSMIGWAPLFGQDLELAPVGETFLKSPQITAAVEAFQKQHKIPGISVAVSQNGKRVFDQGFGLSDIENQVVGNARNGLPNRIDRQAVDGHLCFATGRAGKNRSGRADPPILPRVSRDGKRAHRPAAALSPGRSTALQKCHRTEWHPLLFNAAGFPGPVCQRSAAGPSRHPLPLYDVWVLAVGASGRNGSGTIV